MHPWPSPGAVSVFLLSIPKSEGTWFTSAPTDATSVHSASNGVSTRPKEQEVAGVLEALVEYVWR